ncbi:MAG: YraN family protein [Chloroflexota bacterium]|nr:YraN family protein [Chloroflexota bacterium]
MSTSRIRLGSVAERHARLLLERKGMKFLTANWRCASGEIDLVMQDGSEIAFVEVKARVGERAGTAEAAISAAKARKLLATGEWFLAEHAELGEPAWRIDLVAITIDSRGAVTRISHIPDVVVSG